MAGDVYQATVINGQIQLLSPATLPEKATAYVVVPAEPAPRLRSHKVVDPNRLFSIELTVRNAYAMR